MGSWKSAGMSYVQYSNACAKIVRRCLKPEYAKEALKREEVSMKFNVWKDGKAAPKSQSI
eukprot:Nk52_evm2s675 gene=Nk52_evmTU2s675